MPGKDQTLPLATRAAPVSSVDAEKRTVTLIWTTGATVRRYDWGRDRYYTEALDVTPEAIDLTRLNGGAPLLNSHGSWDLSDIIGVVERAWVENGIGYAEVRFSERPELDGYWRDVQSGVIRNVSVGYAINAVRMEQGEDGNWTYTATRWTPHEISLVPVPADAGCGTRGQQPVDAQGKPLREFPIEIELIERTADAGRDEPPAPAGTPAVTEPASAESRQSPVEETMDKTPEQLAADQEAIRKQAVADERQRIADINANVRAAGLADDVAADLIARGVSVAEANAEVLKKLAARSEETGQRGHSVQVTADHESAQARQESIAAAVQHRAGTRKDLPENAREFRGFTLPELARYSLQQQGVDTRGMSRVEVVQRSLLTTSDFAIALSNVVGRTLRQAYEVAPRSFTAWARKGVITDFRPATRVQVSGAAVLEKTNDHGEFKRGYLGDSGEQIQLATYGKIIGITRQTIINDDLDVFGRIPQIFGQGAAAFESALVYAVLTGNPNMADGTALFHATHGNLAGAGAAISVASLGAGRSAMRLQKEPSSKEPLNLQPKFLIVPAGKETEAQQFITQAYLAAKSADYNPFAGSLELIVEPRLDVNSAVSWYLAADPSAVDTIEYAYLDGAEGLQIASRDSFQSGNDFDGIEIKAFEDFGVKAIDWRGLYKNPGA